MTLWKDVTRSTEKEHQAFMRALKGLCFTREEFISEGPTVIFRKFDEVITKLKEQEKKKK